MVKYWQRIGQILFIGLAPARNFQVGIGMSMKSFQFVLIGFRRVEEKKKGPFVSFPIDNFF